MEDDGDWAAVVEIKKEFTQIAIEAREEKSKERWEEKRLWGFCFCGLGKVPGKVEATVATCG